MAGLAGIDGADDHPGLPPVDGVDRWPYLTGEVAASPRSEMVISAEFKGQDDGLEALSTLVHGCLIKGDLTQPYGFWQGYVWCFVVFFFFFFGNDGHSRAVSPAFPGRVRRACVWCGVCVACVWCVCGGGEGHFCCQRSHHEMMLPFLL